MLLQLTFRFDQQRDVVGGFRRLRESGSIDVLTCAATHGYLPLMRRASTIYGGSQEVQKNIIAKLAFAL